MEHIWTMLMHKILQNHLLCAFVANLKSFCDKNLAIRKVFAFCDSVPCQGPWGQHFSLEISFLCITHFWCRWAHCDKLHWLISNIIDFLLPWSRPGQSESFQNKTYRAPRLLIMKHQFTTLNQEDWPKDYLHLEIHSRVVWWNGVSSRSISSGGC